jgi:hypothetical protein
VSKNTYDIGFHINYTSGYSPDDFRRQGNRIDYHEDSTEKHAPCFSGKPRTRINQPFPSALSLKQVVQPLNALVGRGHKI